MRATFLASLCALLAVATSALASHSASPCASVVTEIAGAARLLYHVDGQEEYQRSGEDDWIYAETNGHPGFQGGGAPWYRFGLPDGGIDWCWDVDEASGWPVRDPDTIVL